MKPIVKKLATAYADGMAQFEHHRLYCIDDFAAGMESVCIAGYATIQHTTRKDGVLSGLCAIRR